MTSTALQSCDLLVLCGGQGTRLRSMVHDRPKPMALVGDRPFLEFVIAPLVAQGIRRVILCTGYMSQQVEQWFLEQEHDYELVFSREACPMGTAGALAQAAHLIRSNVVIVVNGDSVCDVHLAGLWDHHRATGACATVTVTPATGRTDAGRVEMNADTRLTGFQEQCSAQRGSFHNAGIYVFDRCVLSRIPTQCPSSIERDLLPGLLDRGLYGYVTEGPLFDIGTPERLTEFRAHVESLAEANTTSATASPDWRRPRL